LADARQVLNKVHVVNRSSGVAMLMAMHRRFKCFLKIAGSNFKLDYKNLTLPILKAWKSSKRARGEGG